MQDICFIDTKSKKTECQAFGTFEVNIILLEFNPSSYPCEAGPCQRRFIPFERMNLAKKALAFASAFLASLVEMDL